MLSFSASDNRGPSLDFTDEKKVTRGVVDHLRSNNLTFSSKFKAHKIDFNIFRNYESFLGSSPLFSAGAGADQKVEGYYGSYSYNKTFKEKLNIFGSVTYDWGLRNFLRDEVKNVRSNVEGDRIKGLIKGNLKFWKVFNFELGTDYEIRKCVRYSFYNVSDNSVFENNQMDNLTLTERSIFSQLQYTKNKFNILLGNRYVNNELFGDNFSSRASVVYSFNEKNSVKLIYGESFRAPSFFEYYFYTTVGTKNVFGNKNLKPEKSKSIELAYLKSFKNVFFQALLYHGIYEDKIFRTRDLNVILSDGNTLSKYTGATVYVNGETFSANGLEFEMDYANPKLFNAFVNYGYTIGDDGDKTSITSTLRKTTVEVSNFMFVPKHTVGLGLNKTLFEKLTLSTVFNYISETKGAFENIPAYKMLDFNVIFKHSLSKFKLSHIVSVKNIFDEHILMPEYSRVAYVNAVPYGSYRYIGYTLRLDL